LIAPYEEAAKTLSERTEDRGKHIFYEVVLAEVDCTVHSDACAKYSIRGYPTLKYFIHG